MASKLDNPTTDERTITYVFELLTPALVDAPEGTRADSLINQAMAKFLEELGYPEDCEVECIATWDRATDEWRKRLWKSSKDKA